MKTPIKPAPDTAKPGSEGGTPGVVKVEATETLTETVTEFAETSQPGSEGGTPGARSRT